MKYKGGWSDKNYKEYKNLIHSYNPNINEKSNISYTTIENILNNHIDIHIIDRLNNDIKEHINQKNTELTTYSKKDLYEIVLYIRDNIEYFKNRLTDNYIYDLPKITIVPKNTIFKRRQHINRFNKNKESWLDYTSSYKKSFLTNILNENKELNNRLSRIKQHFGIGTVV